MSKVPQKILILGGTKEAAILAKTLVEQGYDVTTSLSGITKSPAPVEGKIRMGGYSKPYISGAMGLAEYLEDECFDQLIDVTHPFAKQISENAKIASKMSGVPLEIKSRPAWIRQHKDIWLEVTNLEEAVSAIPNGANVFLALGSKHIDVFENRPDVTFLVRMVEKPRLPLRLAKHKLIYGIPNSQMNQEKELMLKHNITHLVCRNSGGTGSYAKIEAARELSIPVIIIAQI